MISHFFIDRPIFATVLSIVIVILGVVAVLQLPIAQYPDVTPPTVQVTATYPGANADHGRGDGGHADRGGSQRRRADVVHVLAAARTTAR